VNELLLIPFCYAIRAGIVISTELFIPWITNNSPYRRPPAILGDTFLQPVPTNTTISTAWTHRPEISYESLNLIKTSLRLIFKNGNVSNPYYCIQELHFKF
jgi:hypothetical protein